MANDPELYLLQAQYDGTAWQVIVPFVYLDLAAAKAEAQEYARTYGVVRVINRATRNVEYTARFPARRLYGDSQDGPTRPPRTLVTLM